MLLVQHWFEKCCMTIHVNLLWVWVSNVIPEKYQFQKKFDVNLINLYCNHNNLASLQSHPPLFTTNCKILCVEYSSNQLRYGRQDTATSTTKFLWRLVVYTLFGSDSSVLHYSCQGFIHAFKLGFDLCMHCLNGLPSLLALKVSRLGSQGLSQWGRITLTWLWGCISAADEWCLWGISSTSEQNIRGLGRISPRNAQKP